jgi:hypothetical protein
MPFGKNFSNLETRKLKTHDLGATVVCVSWSYSGMPVLCPFLRFRHTWFFFLVQFK